MRPLWISALAVSCFTPPSLLFGQGTRQASAESSIPDADADHIKERNEWFSRGRVVQGSPTAELRRRAYQAKLRLRAQRGLAQPHANPPVSFSVGSWVPLGPVPLASDASGNGTQDYHQVAGRATSVAIDPADPSGNTVYIGGAQSGVWKSTNAADPVANNVAWAPITDNQATLSIGALAIQPGNSDPARTLILAATGEANNSGDSYFGLGILRSADAGNTWNLVTTANNGALSFSGLGGTRMAFSTLSGQTGTAVAAMAASSEGLIDGSLTNATKRGLYTTQDAGQTWTYNALTDPGGATDATSATSVVYSDYAGKFYAAVRYHGFYSSPDGITWTRLANQPGGARLSAAVCPPQSTSNNYGCPIYRAEIAAVPGRNEMYVWYVYFSLSDQLVDGGIWKSLDGGGTWTSISTIGITNCGDGYGCGIQQGTYNLELLAMPNGTTTDLYAGTINVYKCQVSSVNPTCAASPFINLTHVYGCNPIAAPSHVHPDQHALAAIIPNSGDALLYFANDGGIYRALNAYTGLTNGSCGGINQFDDLNQNLGSMAQFVSFSQHATDPNTMLGGTQDNGSPATSQATTNSSWTNVLGGDGGYNAIDPIMGVNFYASNPDIPPAGLGVQLCTSGVYCNNSLFNFVVTSNTLDGDDGAFYFPFMLDPGSSTAMLIGTCRVWRGPRAGGIFTALSPNFDTLGSGTCSGNEVNQVRAMAAAGRIDGDGSETIYATTSGFGPLEGPLHAPAGGRVWVSTDGTLGPAAFLDVTDNGPQGSINPNQFPISGVAIDPTDISANTAYVTIMGFTGGTGHVWKTTNAGASWTDFTANLPDSPVNAVIVYRPAAPLAPTTMVFVATDVGVFQSPASAPNWTELGAPPDANQPGFLPNVAVTALAVFNHAGQQLLRASTYGRGIWEYDLVPGFKVAISNSPLTVFAGQTSAFNGTVSAVGGYSSAITLSCIAGSTAAPATCAPAPASFTPSAQTPFAVNAGGAVGDYNFNLKAVGSDSNHVTHTVPLTMRVINFGLTAPSPTSVNVLRGTNSTPVSFQVTAAGSFSQSVTVSCATTISGATCNLTPSATVNPTATRPVNMTASVAVPLGTAAASYPVTLQATTAGAPAPLTSSFTLVVAPNPDFVLTEPTAFPQVIVSGARVDGQISIASQDGFSGTVTLACSSTYGTGSCSISPTSVSSFPATATLSIYGTKFTAGGANSVSVNGTSGSTTHSLAVPFNVGDYSISGTQSLTGLPGQEVTADLQLNSLYSYAGTINASCDAAALVGATCVLAPVNPISVAADASTPFTATVSIPSNAPTGAYDISIRTHDTTGAPSHSSLISIHVGDYSISGTQTLSGTPGAQLTANLQIASLGAYTGKITATCDATSLPGAMCTLTPSNPISVPSGGSATLTATISVPSSASPGAYAIRVNAEDTNGLGHSASISLTIGQDFLVTTSTPSQTVTAGQTSGPYALRVQPVGSSFDGAVTLVCTAGLPSGAQCIFNPSTPVTPGNSAVDVVLNISTRASAARSQTPTMHVPTALWLPIVLTAVGWSAFGKHDRKAARQVSRVSLRTGSSDSKRDERTDLSREAAEEHSPRRISWVVSERRSSPEGPKKEESVRRLFSALFLYLAMTAFVSCAGVSQGGDGGGQPPPPVTYHVTITGTSSGTPPSAGQSTTVNLVVN